MILSKLVKRVRSNIREPRENKVQDDEIKDWLNDMSLEATKFLNYPWKWMTIHGVEEQVEYDLPDDYIKLAPLLDVFFDEKKIDKYSGKYLEFKYPLYKKAEGVQFPTHYYIDTIGKISLYPPPKLEAEGTATAGSGLAELLASSAEFSDSQIGFSIRNVTDGSNGLITAVTSGTQLTAALSGGTLNVWTDGDSYKINRSGEVPYVYEETLMAEDDDENIVASLFPYILIYGATVIADMKAFRTDSAAQLRARMDRWDTLYNSKLMEAKKIVNEEIRGQKGRTVSPYERYARRNFTD